MRVIGSDWWPWAAGVAGLVFVLLGIRWRSAVVETAAGSRRSRRQFMKGRKKLEKGVDLLGVVSTDHDDLVAAFKERRLSQVPHRSIACVASIVVPPMSHANAGDEAAEIIDVEPREVLSQQ